METGRDSLREDVCCSTWILYLLEGLVCYPLMASDVQFPFSLCVCICLEGDAKLCVLTVAFVDFLLFFTGRRAEGLFLWNAILHVWS